MKTDAKNISVFDTNKRIRLGIWGLGRGMSFFQTCKFLNIDVVAGCDYNEHMRKNFLNANPGAFVTADADEFLAQDFDAVLLATFCVAHGRDVIKCLQANKHVLSEVTAFFSPAEGVRLVEEVEKRKLAYNLAENYPFSAENMFLARKWKEGAFGELMYAEYEYVHECRTLCYTYIDGKPVQPGNTVHNWRSWMNYHYYCTHSLGPAMLVTGTRPKRVVAFPGNRRLPGYIVEAPKGMGGVAPSLIEMDNGGIVRNLMGATTNDSHIQRLWGTLGSAEINTGKGLQLRLGGSGSSPKFAVNPTWDNLGELASKTGHGGGDFWVLYYFARQIFFGTPGPFDVYGASDVTLPGILALRSALDNGKPQTVPDFRKKADRDAFRSDDWQQKPYDTRKAVFPANADFNITQHFSTTITRLVDYSLQVRAYVEWKKFQSEMVEPHHLVKLIQPLVAGNANIREIYRKARKIADKYPKSDGARVLREMLEIGYEKEVLSPSFLPRLKKELATLKRKFRDYIELGDNYFNKAVGSQLLPARNIKNVPPPPKGIKWTPLRYDDNGHYLDIRPIHNDSKDGMVYIHGKLKVAKAGAGHLLHSPDGPVKVWVNSKEVACEPTATNPITENDKYRAPVKWKKGLNDIVFAILTKNGMAWGLKARAGSSVK